MNKLLSRRGAAGWWAEMRHAPVAAFPCLRRGILSYALALALRSLFFTSKA